MFIALNLIALAVGYKVFVEATKEKKDLKTLGRAIGIFIMMVVFLTSAMALVKYSQAYCQYKSRFGCLPILSKLCPYASRNAGPSAK